MTTPITIRHTMQDGTVVRGSARGDGVWDIVRQHGFRYSRQVGIYIRGSRDRPPQTPRIRAAKAALEAAGHTVTLELETELRPAAVRAEAEAERLADRQERLADRGDRLTERGLATHARADQMASAIPFGQPMMPDHSGYGRDQNYRKRMRRTYDRAFEELDAGRATTDAAQASEQHQAYRQSGPVTERRIKKLEAAERYLMRDLDGRVEFEETDGGWKPKLVKPTGGTRDWLNQRLAEVRDDLQFNRQHLAELTAAGVHRTWGPGDFAKGDQVQHRDGRWSPVVRVNKRSLTVPHPFIAGRTWTIPYDKVRGQRPQAP